MNDGADIGQAKRDLRARMRVVRAAIAADTEGRWTRSRAICTRVVDELKVRPVTHAMVFRALLTEPDVDGVAWWCRRQRIAVHAPVVDGDTLRVGSYFPGTVQSPDDLDPVLLDAVLVPGLAFTADGHRLGQGGGHFDRFLSVLRDDCLTIGVAFGEQLVDEVPFAAHDVTVDLVVTG